MKKKQLRKLAQEIALREELMSQTDDESEKQELRDQIMDLCSKISGFEEMTLIDEMVQEILEK